MMRKESIDTRDFYLCSLLFHPFAHSPIRPFLFTLAILLYCCMLSDADLTYGPVSLSGNLQSQQILRHPELEKWSIIQQRNVIRLRLEYDWIQDGQAFGYFSVPWIRRAHLVSLYRGSYDSVYDFQPGPRQEAFPYRGRLRRDGKLSDLTRGAADALRFESIFREAYSDIEFADDDGTDDTQELMRQLHRDVIPWKEAISYIVNGNLEARAKSPRSADRRPPRRDQRDNRGPRRDKPRS